MTITSKSSLEIILTATDIPIYVGTILGQKAELIRQMPDIVSTEFVNLGPYVCLKDQTTPLPVLIVHCHVQLPKSVSWHGLEVQKNGLKKVSISS